MKTTGSGEATTVNGVLSDSGRKQKVTSSDPLWVKRLPDGRRELLRDLRVDVSRKRDESLVATVPKGFVTDYSSLPFGTRWVVHWSRVDVAGVVHDYMYRCDATLSKSGTTCRVIDYCRPCADAIWHRVAISGYRRANCVQGWLCWLALRVFARCSFQRRSVGWSPDRTPASEQCGTKRLVGLLVVVAVMVALCRCVVWGAIGMGLLALLCGVLLVMAVVLTALVLCDRAENGTEGTRILRRAHGCGCNGEA